MTDEERKRAEQERNSNPANENTVDQDVDSAQEANRKAEKESEGQDGPEDQSTNPEDGNKPKEPKVAP